MSWLGCSKRRGRPWASPSVRGFRVRGIRTCGNSGFSTGLSPIASLYAFDPKRTAILLLGGNKTGDDRWYDKFVPRADDLYDEHLKEIEAEGGEEEPSLGAGDGRLGVVCDGSASMLEPLAKAGKSASLAAASW